MNKQIFKFPVIDESERTPLITNLLEIIQYQSDQIQILRDEIAILKGNKYSGPLRQDINMPSLRG